MCVAETTVAMSEDLELPKASVTRIVKAALPDGTAVGKDAKDAIAVSAKVFIHYVTAW